MSNSDNKLDVMKAEVAASQHFQEQVLSTVYWSLSTVVVLAVLLVGYGWLTNFKIYDRDKQLLEQELRTLISKEGRRLIEEHRIHTDNQIASLTASVSEGLKTSEDHLARSLKGLLEIEQKQFTAQLTQLKTAQNELRNDIWRLQLADELEDRRQDKELGLYRSALQGSVDALRLALMLNDHYDIGEVLDLIAEDFKNILSNKDEQSIDNFLIGQLVEVLGSVTGRHAHIAAALKTQAPKLLST
jgi:hypothetical protein